MPLHPQAVQTLELMREAGFILSPDMSVAEMRQNSIQSQQTGFPPEIGEVIDRTIRGPDGDDLPLRIYKPLPTGAGDGGRSDRLPGVVVFFHGGGWVIGSVENSDLQVRKMVNQTGLVWVSVDYRLAPEHRFPAAVEDAYEATDWVATRGSELGVDTERLAVAGDSAGGNLAAVTTLMARARGGPVIAFQLLVYPACDAKGSGWPSTISNAGGPLLTTDLMDWFYDHYLGERAEMYGDDARVAPLQAMSLAGLPPGLVITAEYDPLRDEGEAYAAALAEAGGDVRAKRYDGMFHGFFGFDASLDTAAAAQSDAAAALRAAIG